MWWRGLMLLAVLLVWIVEESRLLLVYHLPAPDFLATLIVFLGLLWLLRTRKRY
jgi:hypothetical protein